MDKEQWYIKKSMESKKFKVFFLYVPDISNKQKRKLYFVVLKELQDIHVIQNILQKSCFGERKDIN